MVIWESEKEAILSRFLHCVVVTRTEHLPNMKHDKRSWTSIVQLSAPYHTCYCYTVHVMFISRNATEHCSLILLGLYHDIGWAVRDTATRLRCCEVLLHRNAEKSSWDLATPCIDSLFSNSRLNWLNLEITVYARSDHLILGLPCFKENGKMLLKWSK